MSTLRKLQEANDLVIEALDILNELENESLEEYYGYSLEIIKQQLDIFSENNEGYSGNTSLSDIIVEEGNNWNS